MTGEWKHERSEYLAKYGGYRRELKEEIRRITSAMRYPRHVMSTISISEASGQLENGWVTESKEVYPRNVDEIFLPAFTWKKNVGDSGLWEGLKRIGIKEL